MKKQAILAALLGTFLLTGCANKPDGERNDSLEGFNRTMWKFNYNVMDRYVLEPVAKGWNNYVPKRVSSGLTSMANNLDEPVSFVNRLIEGEPKKAFVHFNRFWINTIFGLGGFVDFASASKELRIDHQRGFGETLGSYGVDAGTYIVLPIYNATTLQKEPFGKVKAGTDTFCSFAFSADEVMKADGSFKMYERMNDPELRGTVIGFDKRFIALPIRNKGIGAIVSAKV